MDKEKEKRIDLVLDIETLSRRSNAAIIRITYFPFAFNLPDALMNTNELITTRARVINIDRFSDIAINATTCAMCGMDFDNDTLEWWNKQDLRIRDFYSTRTAFDIKTALERLDFDITIMYDRYEQVRIWCQGTDFDISILNSAFRNILNREAPWKYSDVRDARTYICEIMDLFHPGENPYQYLPKVTGITPHDSVSDCIRTAFNLQYCYNLLSVINANVDHTLAAEEVEKRLHSAYDSIISGNSTQFNNKEHHE